jgi:hypothetical protein
MARVPFPAADFPKGWRGEIMVEATFRDALAVKLVKIARARNQHPNDMLAALVHAAVEDDLVSSIIDDEEAACNV